MGNGCLGHPPKGTLKGFFKQSNSIRKFDFLKAAGGCCLGGGACQRMLLGGGPLLETSPPPRITTPPQDYSATLPASRAGSPSARTPGAQRPLRATWADDGWHSTPGCMQPGTSSAAARRGRRWRCAPPTDPKGQAAARPPATARAPGRRQRNAPESEAATRQARLVHRSHLAGALARRRPVSRTNPAAHRPCHPLPTVAEALAPRTSHPR